MGGLVCSAAACGVLPAEALLLLSFCCFLLPLLLLLTMTLIARPFFENSRHVQTFSR